jgi:hypothetical protein
MWGSVSADLGDASRARRALTSQARCSRLYNIQDVDKKGREVGNHQSLALTIHVARQRVHQPGKLGGDVVRGGDCRLLQLLEATIAAITAKAHSRLHSIKERAQELVQG